MLILAITILSLVRLIVSGDQLSMLLLIVVFAMTAVSVNEHFRERSMNLQNVTDLDLRATQNVQLLVQLSEVDTQTRREIGAWLHSVVQPMLLAIARKARSHDSEVGNEIAAAIDTLNEEVVRRYSHQLFPVQLEIALILALSDLLEGRATYTFDQRMYPLMGESAEQAPTPQFDKKSVESLVPKNQVFFPVQQRYSIYRIIEEAVANAEKKPSTTKIAVDISIPQDQIIVTVIDDGSPKSETLIAGLGMHLIDTYTSLHGGTWALSNIKDGVQFRCELPVVSSREVATK
jgi:signal transduction histidine kinase